ncbi:MAG: HlyD family efflux transporter periplasmic adaptor subunit [Armatimonadota bacterium]|nr:HlyD family efflux transporter periplasmic adaptor subunit [bacterium]
MRKLLTRKNIIIIMLVLAIGITTYLLVRKTPLPEGLVQVNGRIEGDVVVISSKYSGKIAQLLAREGDSVTRGQMVVSLDDPETRDRLEQAQQNMDAVTAQAKAAGQNVGLTSETGSSSIEQAKGQVEQAQGDIEDAQASASSAGANVKNAEAAVRSASVSVRQAQEAVKRYSADVATAKANLQSSQKTVEAAQSQAKLSTANARRFTNLAKEGVVTERQRDEYVTAAAKDQAQLQSALANASSTKAQVTSKQSDLQNARNQVAASQADFQRAQAQLAAARHDQSAANARVLTAIGKKTQAEGILKQAMASPIQVAISKSSHASSSSQVKQARAAVNEQLSILNNLFVVSPITGMVVTRIRDNGEVVTAGSPILEVVDLDKLYLKAYVPENQIGKVRLGLPAKIYVDSYPNEPFDATVKYIASQAEFTPKEVQTPDERVKLVYAVKLYLNKNPGHRLTPGMPADAIIRWKEGVAWRRPQY